MIRHLIKQFLVGILRDALGEHEASVVTTRNSNADDNSREQIALDLLKAEIGRRTASDNAAHRLQKCKQRLEVTTLVVLILNLLAVGYYAVIASQQRDAMRQQIDLSAKALDANERAWVIGEKIKSFYLADAKQIPTFVIDTKNAGKSPAWSIRQAVSCQFMPTRPNLIPDTYPNELTLAPSSQRDRYLKCWSTSTQDARAMLAGREFWLWAITIYTDPFAAGKDRVSFECWHRQTNGRQTFDPCEVGANVYR